MPDGLSEGRRVPQSTVAVGTQIINSFEDSVQRCAQLAGGGYAILVDLSEVDSDQYQVCELARPVLICAS